MKTIFATGGTGRVGSRLIQRLLENGYQVRMLIRQESDLANRLAKMGAEPVVGDLLDPNSYSKALAGCNAVLHLAAVLRRPTVEQAQAVNYQATIDLANQAIHEGARRFVFASTNLIYGPGQETPYRESEPANSLMPYPKSKAAAESALMQLHRDHGLGLRIMRLSFVYGQGDSHLRDAFPMIQDWPDWKRLQMVHHADVAQALLLSLHSDGINGQVFNVAEDAPMTVGELRHLNNLPAVTNDVDYKPGSAWDVMSDTLKIRVRLGYRPHFPSFYSAWAAGAT